MAHIAGTTTATKFEVTLADLRRAGACFDGYNMLVRSLQGREFSASDSIRETYIHFRHDAPIPLKHILESNGVGDAVWALQCVPGADRDERMFSVWCVHRVKHLMTDQRSQDALKVAERFANGRATEEERAVAHDAAQSVAWAAAGAAAKAVAWAAAYAASWDTSRAAAWAASAAGGGGGAWTPVMAAARAAQAQMFIRMCEGTAPWQEAA